MHTILWYILLYVRKKNVYCIMCTYTYECLRLTQWHGKNLCAQGVANIIIVI